MNLTLTLKILDDGFDTVGPPKVSTMQLNGDGTERVLAARLKAFLSQGEDAENMKVRF